MTNALTLPEQTPADDLTKKPKVKQRKKTRSKRSVFSLPRTPVDQIRLGIWIYIGLWLIEGGLRRWVLPGLATPLLVVRDPVVLGIYFLALKSGLWPKNLFMSAMYFLAPLSWLLAIAGGHGNAMVATYGVRCDFVHVPLIFIMARVLTHDDLRRLFRIAVWISIPYTLLMLLQYYSPQSAWVNRGVGGDMEGAGFDGALDKFRPPGTFSFITGPATLYPLFLAAWFYLLVRRQLSTILMILSGFAIVIAIPISISRSLFFGQILVASGGLFACVASGLFKPKVLIQFIVGASIAVGGALLLKDKSDLFDAFAQRWENSTTNNGGVQEAIVGRIIDSMTQPFNDVPAIGYGTGISTQVGQKLATGTRGFGFSEGEWGRILAEGGILLGPLILGFRLSLIWFLTMKVIRAVSRGSWISLAFLFAAAPMVVLSQWGQATSLGAAVITSGLCLSAARKPKRVSRKRLVGSPPQVTNVA